MKSNRDRKPRNLSDGNSISDAHLRAAKAEDSGEPSVPVRDVKKELGL
jgi:hypothetical protein